MKKQLKSFAFAVLAVSAQIYLHKPVFLFA